LVEVADDQAVERCHLPRFTASQRHLPDVAGTAADEPILYGLSSGAHLRRRPRLEPESLVRPRVPAISGHTMLAANHTSAAGVAGVQYEGTIISDLL
jgi:hypothetical protein